MCSSIHRRGDAGKRDPRCCFYHPPWQLLVWRLSWKDCCCGWLWLDLLVISRTLCSAAVSGVMLPTVPDLAGKLKKRGMERSGPTPSAFRRAGGQPALRERPRRSCCYASRRQRSLRLSPPTSGLARSVRRGGAQLDWEFAFHASRRRLRARPGGGGGGVCSWTGSRFVRLSPPTPGLAEGAAEGRSAGLGVCFLRLSPPTPGLARRGRRTGAQLDGEFALHASRRRLRAWPGGGGRTESLLSTPPAVVFGPGSEGAAAGRAAGDISFYASHRRLWAWPWGGRRRGAQLDGEFAVYASRLQLGFHGCNKICCF